MLNSSYIESFRIVEFILTNNPNSFDEQSTFLYEAKSLSDIFANESSFANAIENFAIKYTPSPLEIDGDIVISYDIGQPTVATLTFKDFGIYKSWKSYTRASLPGTPNSYINSPDDKSGEMIDEGYKIYPFADPRLRGRLLVKITWGYLADRDVTETNILEFRGVLFDMQNIEEDETGTFVNVTMSFQNQDFPLNYVRRTFDYPSEVYEESPNSSIVKANEREGGKVDREKSLSEAVKRNEIKYSLSEFDKRRLSWIQGSVSKGKSPRLSLYDIIKNIFEIDYGKSFGVDSETTDVSISSDLLKTDKSTGLVSLKEVYFTRENPLRQEGVTDWFFLTSVGMSNATSGGYGFVLTPLGRRILITTPLSHVKNSSPVVYWYEKTGSRYDIKYDVLKKTDGGKYNLKLLEKPTINVSTSQLYNFNNSWNNTLDGLNIDFRDLNDPTKYEMNRSAMYEADGTETRQFSRFIRKVLSGASVSTEEVLQFYTPISSAKKSINKEQFGLFLRPGGTLTMKTIGNPHVRPLQSAIVKGLIVYYSRYWRIKSYRHYVGATVWLTEYECD